jgi:hypothetical protein
MTPCVEALSLSRSLATNRQARWIRCFTAVEATSLRLISAAVTWRAFNVAARKSAKVLLWLYRNTGHRLNNSLLRCGSWWFPPSEG